MASSQALNSCLSTCSCLIERFTLLSL
ncbi:BnaCnng17370D [Brassica napus]|uniref:BnaCnng17370D protein n=1 Tax=Brassica napus TaxID=3708 RepID=A0A078IHK5_BRANA|nr:BnaCnng17370D [Brassica napus]